MARYSTFGPIDSPLVEDGDGAFVRMVSRLRPSQLKPGEVALSQNGRMGTNLEWQPREGYNAVSGALSQDGVALVARDADENGVIELFANIDIASADLASNVVTVTTTSAHGLTGTLTVGIDSIGFVTTDPNGNRVATVTGATTMTFPLTGGDETFTASTGDVVIPSLDTSTLVETFGSCRFSDPSDSDEDYILIATTNKAIAYKISDGSTTDIDYPGAGTLGNDAEMLQAFGNVYIWRGAGITPWVWDGDLSGSPAFAAVGTGAATQQTIYQTTTNTAISSGVATVTEAAHGRAVGDELEIVSTTLSGQQAQQRIKVATVPGAGSFTYYTDSPDDAGASVVYTTIGSELGGGFSKMPAAAWGVYHQRRLWLPYTHDAEASPASRGINDELIASDVLDGETYDPIGNQFRVTAGTADYLVTVHPFNDDNLLAFNRNSIHLLKGVSGALADVETVLVTAEIGCVARKSLVTYGNQVFFLSDNGVYALSFIDEYNLRGTDLPISEDIQDYIDRINPEASDGAIAAYHDNRYWLWIPLDDSTTNNVCLVYNFLNKGWESVDTFATSSADIIGAHESTSGKRNELFIVTGEGGVARVTNTDRDTDLMVNSAGAEDTAEYAVASRFLSRQLTAGTMDRKKWIYLEAHVRASDTTAADGGFSIVVEDPDSTSAVATISDTFAGEEIPSGNGATIRARCGNIRGYGAQVDFQPSVGRPRLRTAKLTGAVNYRSTTSEK